MYATFTIARSLPSALEEDCRYTRKSAASCQIIADRPSNLPKMPPTPNRTQKFRILDPGPVHLRGFRGFTTQDQQFFLDESLDPNWNRASFAENFRVTGKFEDFEARVFEDHVELADRAPDQTINEPLITLSTGEPANYGSWIYRVLPKLASLPPSDRALFLFEAFPWQQEMMAFFAPQWRIIHHNPRLVYSLTDARIATMRNWVVYFDDQTRDFYQSHARAVPGVSPLRRIYLSRAGQKIRPMLNEADLEAQLVARGFDIVHPEAMPLVDRIRVIRDAEVVVCPGGSGLFNLVFASNAKLVLDIEANRTWINAHTRLMDSLELPHIVLMGQQVQNGNPHAEWTAPLEDATWCLDQFL